MTNANESLKNALFTKEFTHNPYPVYEKLRQSDPILNLQFPDGRFGWLISNYEDAVEALKDGRFSKDVAKAMGQEQTSVFSTNMLFSDPPDHKRLRGLVQKGFTPQRIADMRGHIQEIADNLLDAVSSKDSINLIDEYAFKLPIIVISEILGVPTEDQDKFRVWSNSIIGASNQEMNEQVVQHMNEFIAYLKDWFAKVREQPGDDMISQLVIAENQGGCEGDSDFSSSLMLNNLNTANMKKANPVRDSPFDCVFLRQPKCIEIGTFEIVVFQAEIHL